MKKFLQITMISMLMVSGHGLQGSGEDKNDVKPDGQITIPQSVMDEYIRLNNERKSLRDKGYPMDDGKFKKFAELTELLRLFDLQKQGTELNDRDKSNCKLLQEKYIDNSEDLAKISKIPVLTDVDTPKVPNVTPQSSAISNWYDVVTSTSAKISAALVAMVGAVASVWYYNQPAEHKPVIKHTDVYLQDGKEYSDNQIADESDQQ